MNLAYYVKFKAKNVKTLQTIYKHYNNS